MKDIKIYCPRCKQHKIVIEKLWCYICSSCRRVVKNKLEENDNG